MTAAWFKQGSRYVLTFSGLATLAAGLRQMPCAFLMGFLTGFALSSACLALFCLLLMVFANAKTH